MNIIEIIILAFAVAMDAFAVAICKGITIKSNLNKKAIVVGTWFGMFQGIMPLIGYFFMDNVEKYVQGIKEYVIFGLLLYLGISMIIESRKEENFNDSVDFKTMFVLAIATSLDALSIGMTISLLKVNVFIAISIIALVTFFFSYLGVKIGNRFGNKYKTNAELAGGIILILIGLKVILGYLL